MRKRQSSSYTLEVFKKNQNLLANLVEKNKNDDIAFLVDCTGSMAGYINETKSISKQLCLKSKRFTTPNSELLLLVTGITLMVRIGFSISTLQKILMSSRHL